MVTLSLISSVLSLYGIAYAETTVANTAIETHADVKSFFIASFPYDHIIMPDAPYGQAFLDGRIKIQAKFGQNTKIHIHHAITTGTAPAPSQLALALENMGIDAPTGMSSMMTGVGLQAPEAIKLSWQPLEDASLLLRGRTDRLYLQTSLGAVDVRLGRQPISFGHGMVFAPMDLVQPFSFATIDGEYKPGLDAVRIDGYWGMSTQITGVVAYAGSWDKQGMTGVLHANSTVGVTDISLFTGWIRSDVVVGTGIVSSIGAVEIHGDVTYTIPDTEDKNFLRAVGGFLWKPLANSTLTGELYYQSLGASNTAEYLTFASSDRFARRELWLLGTTYGALAWSEQITPLCTGSLGSIVNPLDHSFLLTPSINLSVDNNVQLVAGGYIAVGDRPKQIDVSQILTGTPLEIHSEFGMMSNSVFVQLKNYF